jgi:FkbM family methyltransferase
MNSISLGLGKLTAPLFGTGIGKMPLVWDIYKLIWMLYRPNSNTPIKVQDNLMYFDKNDYIMAPQLFSTGYWEKFETETFKQFIHEGMTIIDIGANIGYYSLIASKLTGKEGQVYAFEPIPNTYEILQKNIELNKLTNVKTYQKAVIDHKGFIKLHIDNRSPASNSITGNGKYINVSTIALDDLFTDTHIDIIKMDIEGSEALALEGMYYTIKNNPRLKIFTEVCDKKLKKAGSSLEDYVNDLLRWFNIAVIDEQKKELIYCELVRDVMNRAKYKTMVNMLCIRK